MSKRTFISGLAAALGASAVLLAVPGTANAAVGAQLMNEETRLCLDSDMQGNVYTKGCDEEMQNAYQQWRIQIANPAAVTDALRNVMTGKCLEVDDGDGVSAQPCNYGKKQQFSFVDHYGMKILKSAYNGRALDSNKKGQAYTSQLSTSNPYMRWYVTYG
ncbi:ricin-type beta-trefoil lectin domain protein [Streptomyces sp. NPDC014623]|uniref:RICIN domain-containing protein n=1 Tax=Streptomyces sp. NPDC014623 TaxID=3364875 RepID=UPI0036F5B224